MLSVRIARIVIAVSVMGLPLAATAGGADVLEVKVTPGASGYRFDVTVSHDDEGWDHYANVWQVVGPEGAVFGERVLAHPHENEQPFTRSKSGILIPNGITRVIVRAGDSVHGFTGKEMTVTLPDR